MQYEPRDRGHRQGSGDDLWYPLDMDNLEKLIVEHPAFSWLDGMMAVSTIDAGHGYFVRQSGGEMNKMEDVYPLLDDPPTKGGMLHLIRRAWKHPVRTEYDHIMEKWLVWMDSELIGYGQTEGEALGHALVNSPDPCEAFPALITKD